MNVADTLPILPAFYDVGRKVYWTQDVRGAWMQLTENAFRRHLRAAGYSHTEIPGEPISPVDKALVEYESQHNVAYAGPLAGAKTGLIEVSGRRILVTDSAMLIEPRDGECLTIEALLAGMFADPTQDNGQDQMAYLYGWLKIAIEALREGHYRPGQALVIAGPRDSGKSLLQNLITRLVGGRAAKPYRYMTDQTHFNAELFGAEHLMIEDECASTDIRTRRKFGARIKEFTVNEYNSCHAKSRQAITLRPFWRLTMTLNDEPENLMMLPPLDESLEDKIILLRAYKNPMPMPALTNDDRNKFWDKLVEELPAFIYHLLHFRIPRDLESVRFGVKHFHHPELLKGIDALAPETRLLGIIDSVFFNSPNPTSSWTGTADELERALCESPLAYGAKGLLDWVNATGTYLGRLARKHPHRITNSRTHSDRRWTIAAP